MNCELIKSHIFGLELRLTCRNVHVVLIVQHLRGDAGRTYQSGQELSQQQCPPDAPEIEEPVSDRNWARFNCFCVIDARNLSHVMLPICLTPVI